MPSAAALRLQIENALASRIPGALTPRPRILRDLAATGIPELDTLLEGGLPIGAISELVGKHSSGRTTLAFAAMAEMTQAGKTVAWVDTSDALDPQSAAAAGIELSRQLWVRCGEKPGSGSATGTLMDKLSPPKGAAYLAEGSHAPASSGGCGSPHPRGEARGLSQAVDAFLHPGVIPRPGAPRVSVDPRRNRQIGTPGAPNRKLVDSTQDRAPLDRTPQDPRPIPRRAVDREEQIPSDRQPSRRQALQMQRQSGTPVKSLSSAQIANTAAVARNRTQGGAWTDNGNNAAGRCLATPPEAIAAGLPRREMEACVTGSPVSKAPGKMSLPMAIPFQAAQPGGPALTGVRQRSVASLAGEPPSASGQRTSPLWRALDQALRATDLLLAAGGFGAIVLDLGSIPPEFVWRIPLATWFRFRTAADRAHAVLLVLTQHPCARSSAELVLRLSPTQMQSAATVLTGARFRVSVDRRRFETPPVPAATMPAVTPGNSAQPNRLHLVSSRKQPQREREAVWGRAAAWTGTEPKTPQGGSL